VPRNIFYCREELPIYHLKANEIMGLKGAEHEQFSYRKWSYPAFSGETFPVWKSSEFCRQLFISFPAGSRGKMTGKFR
jgi:hypothetical protein